jgi:hypothetical protein
MPPRTNEALPVRHGISDFLQASGAVHAARCSCYGRSPPMRAECPVPTMALSEPARLLPSPCRHSNRRTGKQTHRQTDAPARRMPGCSAGHRAPQRPGSSVRAQSLSMHLHRRCKCRAVQRLTPTALNIDARAATPVMPAKATTFLVARRQEPMRVGVAARRWIGLGMHPTARVVDAGLRRHDGGTAEASIIRTAGITPSRSGSLAPGGLWAVRWIVR